MIRLDFEGNCIMERPFFTLDVFTDQKLKGNPLAVVTECKGLSDNDLQNIAAEFNLPETVFIFPSEREGTQAKLRIFTPGRELPFAGHPTIGTAILLGSLNSQEEHFIGELVLEEKAGLVPVSVKCAEKTGEAEFISPGLPEKFESINNKNTIAAAISLQKEDIGFAYHIPCFAEAAGNKWLFIPVQNSETIKRAKVDLSYWEAAKEDKKIVGCYVYTNECVSSDASYHARMFAPDVGVTEDPATGSAAATFPGCVAAFENLPDGRYDWLIEQGYEMGRPSQIYVSVTMESSMIIEVRIGGKAVLLMSGEIEF